MMEFRPLCVLLTPRSRIRSMPHGKSTSSKMTISPVGSRSYRCTKSRTERPLRFIIVCGLARRTSCPASVPRPTYALASGRSTRIPAFSAIWSTARKPRLCGVQTCSGPGLPSPTISLMRRTAVERTVRAFPRLNKRRHTSIPRRTGPPLLLLLLVLVLVLVLLFLFLLGLFFPGLGDFFAFFFLLALLDDFGFGRRRRFRSHGLGRLFFLGAQGNHVGDDALRVGHQRHFRGIDGQVA